MNYLKQLFVGMVVILSVNFNAFADDDYKVFVEDTRAAVYSMDLPAFSVREIPDKYKDESAVYVAVYNDIDARKKTGFGHLPGTIRFSRKARVEGGELLRLLIFINDKAALEKYSEFDFGTDMKKKMSNAHRRQRHAMGVKVIKQDGREIDVATDEFVEVEDGKDKRRKLAVPGLEVGDMLDVFFYTEHKLQNVHLDPFTFVLRDVYPVMDYKIHAVVDDNLTTQYRTLNGAPDFAISRDEEKNYVLDMNVKDIPARPRIWYSDAEQSPMVKMWIFNRRSDAYTPWSARKDGMQSNPDVCDIKNDYWSARNNMMFYPAKNLVKDKLKNGDKAIKTISKLFKEGKLDMVQASDYFYNLLTLIYFVYDIKMYQMSFDIQLAQLMKGLDKGCVTTCILTDVDEEPLDSLISMYNVSSGNKLCDGKRYYFYPRAAMAPSELHPDFLGRKAQMYYTEKYRKKHPEVDTVYTVMNGTTPADNRNVTVLDVSVDGSALEISRRESYLGSTKVPVQWLLSEEDVVDAYLKYLNRYGIELSLKEKTKKAQDRAERYAAERDERTKTFKDEVESYHGEVATEFGEARLLSVGIDPDAPELVYSVDYKADGLVKRAGDNIVVSVGKLLSAQTELTAADRLRNDAVVMSAPREFVTEINIKVPVGYKVSHKSLDRLSRSLSNNAGCFKVAASLSGDTVSVVVTKRYDHRIEPESEWKNLCAIIDEASAWQAATLLFEK